MNKLVIVNNVLKEKHLLDSISMDWKKECVPKLNIKVCQDTSLKINLQSIEETKLNVQIEVKPNVKCEIQMIHQGEKSEVMIDYNIHKNGKLSIVKVVDMHFVKHQEIVNLKEENAQIEYILKTACVGKENYDLQIYHHAQNTSSNIINHGINLEDGSLSFNVSTYVSEGIKGCNANQINRIINLTNQECTIKPNLFIEEYDVVANHSAHIGSFKEEEIFYLERLGIPYEKVCKLLLQGFMKSYVDEDIITKIFEKYWR